MMTSRRRTACAVIVASFACVACGGGGPLLHPAQTLPNGDVRVTGGVSANVAVGSLANDLAGARDIAARDPQAPGPPGTNAAYARGALVSAAIAPGLAPFIGARVGIGNQYEGGLAYTGRSVRADMRKAFDLSTNWALSVGLGAMAALYGRQQGSDLPNVALGSLHGYGLDLPVIVGWQSPGGIYMLWTGLRGGFEYDVVENVTTEPKDVTIGVPPIHLDATRAWGGGVLGVATGFRHVHVAIELDASFQYVSGTYNDTKVNVQGLTLTPATALWWSF